MPCTEYLVLNLADNVKIDSLETNEIFQELLKTVRASPGCEKLHWGKSQEDDKLCFWFIDWTTYEDHKRFMEHDQYPEFVNRIKQFANNSHPNGPLEMIHVNFDPVSPSNLVSADRPVLEALSVDLKDDKTLEKVNAAIKPFNEALKKASTSGIVGIAREDPKKCIIMIAWESIETHLQFRETEAFKSTIGEVRDLWTTVKMNHVHDMQEILP